MLNLSQADIQPHRMVSVLGLAQNTQMAKVTTRFKKTPPRYFFKEWRTYRGFIQEELAELVGMTASSISQLEKGKQGFTDSTLEALADALNCSAGDLLMRNPLDEDAPWSIWDNIPKHDRPQALKVLKSFVKSGAAG